MPLLTSFFERLCDGSKSRSCKFGKVMLQQQPGRVRLKAHDFCHTQFVQSEQRELGVDV